MSYDFEQACKDYVKRPVHSALAKFARKHTIFTSYNLDRAIVEAPRVINRSRSGRFVHESRCFCVSCGAMGNLVMTYRHNNEGKGTRHTDIFVLTEGVFRMITIDHTLPKSLGGSNEHTNLLPMCDKCNSTKSNNLTRREVKEILHKIDQHLHVGDVGARKFIKYLADEHPDLHNEFVSEIQAHRMGYSVRQAVINVSDRFTYVPAQIELPTALIVPPKSTIFVE